MLRIGYLPSDFNPMVLMLGEAEDFRLLSGVLRRFARDATDVALDGRLTLERSIGPLGMQPSDAGWFHWRLDADRAAAFADAIDRLAHPSCLAGSEILACGSEHETPVKVSRGEYTDDFLTAY
jgi:hypothetical protein